MTKTSFCYCIPNRLGVLLMAPLSCLLSICSSAITIYGLVQFWYDISKWQRVFLCSITALTIIVALASIFGFIGALIKNQNSVNIYSNVLYSLWLSLVATGILNFVFTMKDQDDFIENCFQSQDQSWKWCKRAFRLSFALSIALWGCIVFVGLYLTTIVRRYARQLQEEAEPTYPRPMDSVVMQQTYRSEEYQGTGAKD